MHARKLLIATVLTLALPATATAGDDKTPELYEQIGRLKVELDWVKKKAAAIG